MALKISFTSSAFRHRLRQGGGRGQALTKAVGLSKGNTPNIVDATAGLGRDGFILAHLGANVTMIERSEPVATALQSALDQALADEPLFAQPAARITLLRGDAKALLPGLSPMVSYLDPMHPTRTKSALVKQNLRNLRSMVGDDSDRDALILIALNNTKQRVVVKWPKNASWPTSLPKPSYQAIGKTTRYCVFVCQNTKKS